jgi:hypothetical protein
MRGLRNGLRIQSSRRWDSRHIRQGAKLNQIEGFVIVVAIK